MTLTENSGLVDRASRSQLPVEQGGDWGKRSIGESGEVSRARNGTHESP